MSDTAQNVRYCSKCQILLKMSDTAQNVRYCSKCQILLKMSDTAQNVRYCSKCQILLKIPYIYFYNTKLSFHLRNCNAGLPLKPATFTSTATVCSILCHRTGQHINTGGKPQYFCHMHHIFMVTPDRGTIPFEKLKFTIDNERHKYT